MEGVRVIPSNVCAPTLIFFQVLLSLTNLQAASREVVSMLLEGGQEEWDHHASLFLQLRVYNISNFNYYTKKILSIIN